MALDQVLVGTLRRDRLIVTSGLLAVTLASWGYVLAGAGMGMSAFEMTAASAMMSTGMDGGMGAMMMPAVWTPGYALLMLVMWWVMMVAMMLPSASPMILLYATIARKREASAGPFLPTGLFACAYALVWAAFSLVAVALQWALEASGLLSPMLVGTSPLLAAIMLLAAGVYQLTPLKQACLRHCRSPVSFLMTHWRRDPAGAFRMGLYHGAYCVGCCWFLMGLLFVGGVMNLWWIGALALLVLAEKTIPAGHPFSYALGAILLVWGATILVRTI